MSAQTVSGPASATPAFWLQLRNGTDNTGAVPGTLEVNWRFKAQRPVRGLAVANGLVVIGTESADADAAPDQFSKDQRGFVAALDATTGKPLWTHEVSSWVHGDPAVYRGRVVVTYGRWPMTHPGGVTAFEARTGKVIWSHDAESGMMPAPTVDTTRNWVVVAGGDGILYTISIPTGEILQSTGLMSAAAMSSPRIDDKGLVFLGTAESLRTYSLHDHKFVWTFRAATLRAIGDIPVALSDTIVFTTGTRSVGFWRAAHVLPLGRFTSLVHEASKARRLSTYRGWFKQQWLLAIDRRDGHLLWQRPLGIGLEVPRNTSGTPVLTNGRVIVSSPVSGTIWAFNLESGEQLWTRQLDAIHKGAVTVAGDEMVFGDKKGRINIVRVSDGAMLGSCRTTSSFTPFAPVLVGRTMFVATRDGWVYATPFDSLRKRVIERVQQPCF